MANIESATSIGHERGYPLSDTERIALAKKVLPIVIEWDADTREGRLAEALEQMTGVGPDVARLAVQGALDSEAQSSAVNPEDTDKNLANY